jgi:hypothetical protein
MCKEKKYHCICVLSEILSPQIAKNWVRISKNPQYANPQIERIISVRKFADLRIAELTYGPLTFAFLLSFFKHTHTIIEQKRCLKMTFFEWIQEKVLAIFLL